MDLAALLFPPTQGTPVLVRYSLRGRLGASMLARATRRQAASVTARIADELTGCAAPLLCPRDGAFHAATAAAAREWKAL